MRRVVLGLAVCLLSCIVRGESTTVDGRTWYYSFNSSGMLTVTGVSPATGALAIPSNLDWWSVTSIGEYAFSGCRGLTSVTIPAGVTEIGREAFYDCRGLTSVTIPAGVTEIGDNAFFSCSALRSFTVDSDNTNYKSANGLLLSKDGKTLVAGVNGDIVIPSGVTYIEGGAFYDCRGLTSVTIPDGVRMIGHAAFSGCSGLTSVTIPASVTEIGYYEFSGCSGLTSVTIPDGVTYIWDEAFSGCSGLTSVTIPASVMWIGRDAFSACSALRSFTVDADNASYKSVNGLLLSKDGTTLIAGVNGDVVIPDGVTNIWDEAFSGCSGLTSVTIPAGVTEIGGGAFSGCSGLAKIVFAGDAPTDVDDDAFPSSATVYVQRDSTGWGVEIPGTWQGMEIRYVGSGDNWDPADDTPSGGTWLYPSTTVQTHGPHELNADDYYDFFRVEMTAGRPYTFKTTSDGDTYGELFASADDLNRIAYDDDNGGNSDFKLSYTPTESGTYYLRVRAYSEGRSLSYTLAYDAAFPDGLDVGDEGTVDVDGRTWMYRVEDDETATVTGVSPATGAIAIPPTLGGRPVTGIDDWAFEGSGDLTSVSIPASVEYVSGTAFAGCGALTDISVDAANACYVSTNGLLLSWWDGWGWTLVRGAADLRSVSVPDDVVEIGPCAFDGCAALESLHIPADVAEIGEYAFAGCGALTDISVDAANEYCVSTNGLLLTWWGALVRGAADLESVSLSDDVVEILADAFSGCKRLREVVVPPGVTEIGESAFEGCSGLREIVIGADVALVFEDAFAGCAGLEKIVFRGDAPSYLDGDGDSCEDEAGNPQLLFPDADASRCTVFVEEDSADWGVEIPGTWQGLPIRYSARTLTDADVWVLDWFGVYDGAAHGISVGVVSGIGDATVAYAATRGGPYSSTPPTWTDAGTQTTWYVVSAPGYAPLTNAATVAVERRRVTLVSGSASKTYDGTAFTCREVSVGGDGFAPGEGATYSFTGSQTAVGSSANTFTYTLKSGTKASNYDIVVAYGTLAVTDPVWTYDVNADGTATVTGVSPATGAIAIPPILDGHRVTTLGAYAFSGCANLKSMTIPPSVTNIGEGAFYYCTGLESVTIPPSVTSIGSYAFYDCIGLKEIVFAGNAPADVGDWAFPSSATVYVKPGSADWGVEIPGTWQGLPIRYADGAAAPALPTVVDDTGAIVTGDAAAGYTVTPSVDNKNVTVTIPDGVSAAKVTVVVGPDVATIRSDGAVLKVVRNGHDITAYLDIPDADYGVIDLASATVKESIVKETLDIAKGAVINLSPSNPSLTTAPTRKGLVYTLREGTALDAMRNITEKVGDGQPWTPTLTVKGGSRGFYSIRVDK